MSGSSAPRTASSSAWRLSAAWPSSTGSAPISAARWCCRPPPVAALVAAIPENAWTRLEDYPETGEAQIAETTLSGRRLVVRRVRLIAAPGELSSREWRHFPFATNRTEAIGVVEAEHRQHAVVEQVIRDLKDKPSPARWPWQNDLAAALKRLRALPAPA